MNDEKWLEAMAILIKYKFADKGTVESTTDEIYNLFLDKDTIVAKSKPKDWDDIINLIKSGDMKVVYNDGRIIKLEKCKESAENKTKDLIKEKMANEINKGYDVSSKKGERK